MYHAPPPPPRPPVPVREYQAAYRLPWLPWWKPLLLLICAAVTWLLVQVVLVGIAMGINVATGRQSLDQVLNGELAMTPWIILANNLTLAALIPIGMLFQWAFTGQRPGFLSSVAGRIRWRWLLRASLVIVPVWAIWLIGWNVLAPDQAGTPTDVALLLAITFLTTPLQAAGEEYGFRGTVNRCVAAWFKHPTVALVAGAVVSSLLFMAAHLASDPWLLVYYFCFGLTMCVLTWRSGGLESAIVLHTVNNVISFVITILAGGMDQVFRREQGAGSPVILLSLLAAAVVAWLVDLVARRMGLIRTGRPGVGEATDRGQLPPAPMTNA